MHITITSGWHVYRNIIKYIPNNSDSLFYVDKLEMSLTVATKKSKLVKYDNCFEREGWQG